ncbi:MAG: anaerobic ribonucleoside-triphosphate reductase, partial [Candidatus Margulisiibacteriota bacterium]
EKEKKCGLPTEVYSRVVGYFRPVQNWNEGKKEEFKDRKTFRSVYLDSTVMLNHAA